MIWFCCHLFGLIHLLVNGLNILVNGLNILGLFEFVSHWYFYLHRFEVDYCWLAWFCIGVVDGDVIGIML